MISCMISYIKNYDIAYDIIYDGNFSLSCVNDIIPKTMILRMISDIIVCAVISCMIPQKQL